MSNILNPFFGKSILFLSAWICLSTVVDAQTAGETAEGTDTVLVDEYVRAFPNTLTIRTFVGEKVSAYSLQDKKIGQRINYYPNNILAFGVGVTIKGIGINVSTRLPFHDSKEDKYGVTKRYDIQVHRYRRKLAVDLYLQRYKGFHLNTLEDVDSVAGTTPYPYFPQMRTIRLGGTAMYLFNGNRFSMRAAVNQQDWQVRSAGSFMVGVGVFAQLIHNDSANIIPSYYDYPDFLEVDGLKQINNYSITFNGGYGYNYVFPNTHYFIGLSGDVGAGPAYSRILDMQGDQQARVGLNISANFRAAAGYNSKNWFAGIYCILHGDQYSLPVRESSVTNAQGIARFVVARRLATRRFGVSGNGK